MALAAILAAVLVPGLAGQCRSGGTVEGDAPVRLALRAQADHVARHQADNDHSDGCQYQNFATLQIRHASWRPRFMALVGAAPLEAADACPGWPFVPPTPCGCGCTRQESSCPDRFR